MVSKLQWTYASGIISCVTLLPPKNNRTYHDSKFILTEKETKRKEGVINAAITCN